MTTKIAFFITGMGRSGTMWLARLLDEAEGVCVYHEPLKRGVGILERGHRFTFDRCVVHLCQRKTQMVLPEGQRWGEVNSYLRYWVEPLRAVFPGAPVLGLVRDGKKTVASLVRRGVYAPSDRRRLPLPPKAAQDQLAKCCWYWADTYERLLEQQVFIFTLESLNESYTACELLCEEIGIQIGRSVWERYAGRLIHNDKGSLGQPPFTAAQEEVFARWAGAIYQELGYEID